MTFKPLLVAASILTLAACSQPEQNPEMLKGANFVSKANGADITLTFAPEEMRVYGQVVNMYNGSYQAEGNQIKFTPFASTMMMGPMDAMQTEQEYFQFMATVETYELDGGRLTLKNADGKEIVFEQVEVAQPETATEEAAPAEQAPSAEEVDCSEPVAAK